MTEASVLDSILELQFIVAWAGEGRTEPPRQPWWRTSWIDEFGGHDLLARLTPRTADWAQYELAREAARRVDRKNLDKQADAGRIRTLFHLGPDLDLELGERLLDLKTNEKVPTEVMPRLRITKSQYSPDTFAGFLGDLGEKRNFVDEPFGKRLQGTVPHSPVELVRTLAQGLLPLGDAFPRPYAVA